jgi:hypothetical protein
MSESTETAAASSEGDSISEILEHLPPEVAQALGKSKEPAPAPKAEDSEEVKTDEEETEESADEESEDAADEEADDEPADEESEEENSKPKSLDKLEKRIDKLTRRRKEAETAAEQLRAENESLKAEVEKRSAIKLEPTAEDPLADIDSADDLDAKVSAAKKVRAWALANPDGATITGPDGAERYVDRAEMAKYIAQTDALLTDHAPTRREYLREREAILPEAKSAYPDLFKAGTQAHKVMVDTLKRVPALKRLPNYEMIVGDALAGMSARMAAAAKSDAAGTPKKSAPAPGAKKIAPAIPKATASRPPSTNGKAKNSSLDRVIAGGGIDDLANYFAAA